MFAIFLAVKAESDFFFFFRFCLVYFGILLDFYFPETAPIQMYFSESADGK